ncbi:MAG: DUF4105 domain-containing protein [Opitutaceae bacterium]|nr:DUF4105 domain-containing protein [Cytophagales bacterium]
MKFSKLQVVIALLGALFFYTSGFSASRLSSNAQVSLITISPGQDLYSAFGHSTIWIYDPQNQIDRVYNYGTFDFEQPGFYLNFVKGHLDYTLSVYSFEIQYLSAQQEGRGLDQQLLGLDSNQKQALFDFLEWNALPQNAHYKYDFYLDNCSSRIRDIFQKNCGENLHYDPSITTPYSFREWMNIFLLPYPWSSLGMNIGLGAPSDKKTDYLTQMYLPLNLKLGVASATNSGKPLVNQEKEILYPFENDVKVNNPVLSVTMVIFAMAMLLIFSKGRFAYFSIAFDSLLFIIVTVLGFVLALLWIATDHWVCAGNTDLLWANPFCVFYFLLVTKYKNSKITFYLCLSLVILSAFYYTIGYLLPEKPLFLMMPFVLALQVRVVFRLYRNYFKNNPA